MLRHYDVQYYENDNQCIYNSLTCLQLTDNVLLNILLDTLDIAQINADLNWPDSLSIH